VDIHRMNARSGAAAKAFLAVTIDPLQSQKKQVLSAGECACADEILPVFVRSF
jgi:hypothetical protein